NGIWQEPAFPIGYPSLPGTVARRMHSGDHAHRFPGSRPCKNSLEGPWVGKESSANRRFTGSQREELLAQFRRGDIPILLLSPEYALGSARDALVEAAHAPENKHFGLNARLRTLVVDEAHIIESWGRSFRPDFQRLPGLLDQLRVANPAL